MERIRETGDKTTRETAYYLLGAPLTPEHFAAVTRCHWGVENRLHWRLDVTMGEDQQRNRLDNGPNNLAVLRHMALNLISKDKSKGSLPKKISAAQHSMTPSWPSSWLSFEMRLPLLSTCRRRSARPSPGRARPRASRPNRTPSRAPRAADATACATARNDQEPPRSSTAAGTREAKQSAQRQAIPRSLSIPSK